MGWRMRERGRARRSTVATLHHTIWRTRARKSCSMSANAETLMRSLLPFSSGLEPGEVTCAADPSVAGAGGGCAGLLRDLHEQVVVEVGPTALKRARAARTRTRCSRVKARSIGTT